MARERVPRTANLTLTNLSHVNRGKTGIPRHAPRLFKNVPDTRCQPFPATFTKLASPGIEIELMDLSKRVRFSKQVTNVFKERERERNFLEFREAKRGNATNVCTLNGKACHGFVYTKLVRAPNSLICRLNSGSKFSNRGRGGSLMQTEGKWRKFSGPNEKDRERSRAA